MRYGVLLAVVGTVGCAGSQRIEPPAPVPLVDRVTSAIDSATGGTLGRTQWGILVTDARTGAVLHARDERLHFVPASNAKLVVTTVAMGVLGPDWRYRTAVHAVRPAGTPAGVARALVVTATGDPTWSERFHGSDRAVFEAWADSIAAAGIRRIDGAILVDASRFDDERVHSAWEVGDLVWSYATPVSAFAVGEGAARVIVRAGDAPGADATVVIDGPADAVPVALDVLTDTTGARASIDVARGPWDDTLRITGTLATGRADTSYLAVTDPAVYAARLLEDVLEARGIPVRDGVEVTRDSILGAGARSADGAARVFTWSSAPMAEIVAAILKPSQNWIAEMVLKTLGAEADGTGSWASGLRVERRYLIDRAGVDSLAFSLRDASGLSAQNLLSPDAIVRLLAHAAGQPWGATYRAALAVPGQSGTLSRRLQGFEARVAAKTGTIANVNSLSGYLRADSGRELIFSILTNASGRPSGEVRNAIDRIVRAVASGY